MKSISASIIVLAATILLLGGSLVHHPPTRGLMQIIGCVIGLIGLGSWFVSFRGK